MKKYAKITEQEIEQLEQIFSDLTEDEQAQFIYRKGFYDIEFFTDYHLMHWKCDPNTGEYIESPKYHKEIWKALDEGINLNIIIARGHGKTTAIKMWILHKIVYGLISKIIYISSGSLGEESIGSLRVELELNQTILAIFGRLAPTNEKDMDEETRQKMKLKKWRQKELELLNDCGVMAMSKGESVRGKRPKKIIFDDPQENHEVLSKTLVDKFNYWVFSSLYNTLLPGGSMCILGTIIGNLCLVKYVRDEKKWKTIEYKACDANFEDILWKDMWNKESLIARQKIVGSAIFNQEFRNIPISKADTIIKEHWIRYWEILPEEFDYIDMAVDPAIGLKEKNDFTGVSVVGVKGPNKYVLFSKGLKLSQNNLQTMIKVIYARFKPNSILVENVAYQEMLRQALATAGLPVIGIKPHKDKITRLREISGQIEFGNVYFKRGEEQENLIYQLTNAPDVEHDDELDALVYCLANANSSSASSLMFT